MPKENTSIKMTRFCIYLILSLHGVSSLFSQSDDSLSYLKYVVKTLASDSLEGRGVGTIGEVKSADFIVKQLKLLKLQAQVQAFQFQLSDTTKEINAQNIFAFLNHKKDSTIVISAHYDHIGFGDKLSLHANKKGIHNGADDNASGVALILNIVKNNQINLNKKYNYIFVFYSAHELGLFGSEHFVKYFPKKYKPIAQVINFDMVGRMDISYKILKLFYSPNLKGKLEASATTFGYFQYRWEGDAWLKTLDTKHYFQKNIPCLSITTGIHVDYHKTTDDADKINYQGILKIQNYTLHYLNSLSPE